jgi:excinuclease ABC subunit C
LHSNSGDKAGGFAVGSGSAMLFSHEIDFDPGEPDLVLARLPARPAVFALRGVTGEPYLNRTANLRQRLIRLLTPAPTQSRRLQLAGLVRRIAWTETASDFSAQLLLYRASIAVYGERAAQRLHLRAPYFLRMGMRNRFPRVWVTNTLTLAAADDLFGPFPSRHAAERYGEAALDLHLLRRCFQDLEPDPVFPGCIYSEMKKCLAPCYGGCSDERYAEETAAVHGFLRTRGASLLQLLAGERDHASEVLDFEAAAAAHTRYSKVQAVAALAPEIAEPLGAQHAVMVQPDAEPDQVALYLWKGGILTGPVLFSVLGMRLPNEQSGSSSLFAHPAAYAAVPLEPANQEAPQQQTAVETPEDRLREALDVLAGQNNSAHPDPGKQVLCDHQALLARWYFRPQAKREGELVLADPAHGTVPFKLLLRATARVYRTYAERHAPAQTVAHAP